MSQTKKPSENITAITLILLLVGITYALWTAKTDLTDNPKNTENEHLQNNPIDASHELTPVTTILHADKAEPLNNTTLTTVFEQLMVSNPRNSPDDFQAGIGLIVYKNDYQDINDLEWKTKEILDRIAQNNVNSLSINIPLYQDSYRSSVVYKNENLTPNNEEIIFIVRQAKLRGFSVMVRPFLDEQSISYNPDGKYTGEWRGTIKPENKDKWFETYSDILTEYAKLSEDEGVEFFTVGTELTSMEKYSEDWEILIESLRKNYSGLMTYSSNRIISEEIPWHVLDFVSVDAFYFLDVDENSATQNNIQEAWNPWLEVIVAKIRELQKPLVLTELGTSSQKGSFKSSWVWDHKTPLDMEAQRIYYKASCEALKPYTSGIYWWVVNIWLPEEPLQDSGFNPLGKPAETEIKSCFEH